MVRRPGTMSLTDYRYTGLRRRYRRVLRGAVPLVIFTVCFMSLTGCMKWFHGEAAPVQAVSVPEPDKTASRGDTNSSAGLINPVNTPANTADKTDKDTVTPGTAPCATANGRTPQGSAEPVVRLPDNLKSSVPATFVYKGETLTEDTVWSGRVTIRDSLTIAPQTTVTVSPGTVVEFSRSSGRENAAVLLVRGRIAVSGTKDQPVRFLPQGDDALSATWQGIVLLASEKNNVLEHCRVEGAEVGVDADYSTVTVKDSFFSGCRTALRARDCRLRISTSSVSNCDVGAALYDSEAEIEGMTLVSNRKGIFTKKSSLYLADTIISENTMEAFSAEESNLKAVGNKILGNGGGMELTTSAGLISGNRIMQNRDYGISMTGSRVRVTANDISKNGRIGMRVADGRGIAWGNIISANGQYDLYNAGQEDFRAIGNWWGEGSAASSPGKIYDKAADPRSGKVIRFPFLQAKPGVLP